LVAELAPAAAIRDEVPVALEPDTEDTEAEGGDWKREAIPVVLEGRIKRGNVRIIARKYSHSFKYLCQQSI
jgi:hypothetical protein